MKNYLRNCNIPKYVKGKVTGYYLYFTSSCLSEPIHTHASDSKLKEGGSAKLWIHKDGSSTIQNKGICSDKELKIMQKYITNNIAIFIDTWKDKNSQIVEFRKIPDENQIIQDSKSNKLNIF